MTLPSCYTTKPACVHSLGNLPPKIWRASARSKNLLPESSCLRPNPKRNYVLQPRVARHGNWSLVRWIFPKLVKRNSHKKCPHLSARVTSSPLLSLSKPPSRRIAKNRCYNRRMKGLLHGGLTLTLNRSVPTHRTVSHASSVHVFPSLTIRGWDPKLTKTDQN